jgi:protein arginine kinase activator
MPLFLPPPRADRIDLMTCQKCAKREAIRHESVRAEDGSWTEVHLCEQCAEKMDTGALSQASLVQALIESAAQIAGIRPAGPGKACPKCGITYAEFRARGRLGCPHDYEVFLPEMLPLVERIHHGGAQHVGKSPASTDGRSEKDRELIELRRSLSEAIQGERYEEAARIRDRVRALEEGKSAPPPKPERKPPRGRKK